MNQNNKKNQNSFVQQNTNLSFQQLQSKYISLLKDFNSFKQASISDHQKIIQQQQKINAQNQKFIKKLQKKYESLLHEERQKYTKMKEKLQSQIEKQKSTYQEIIENKNQSIEKLSQMIQDSQREKTQIVEENTQNLINIVRSEQNIMEAKKYSHTELMKMYQYLLEENNCLKKQLIKVQQNKSNQKTKRNKKSSPILYTDQSEVGSSKYVTVSGYQSSSMQKREKTFSNEDKKSSLYMNTSVVSNSQNELKPASVYKPKTNTQMSKKNKINSSYQTNQQSSIIEQKVPKKKQVKKNLIPNQSMIKKPK